MGLSILKIMFVSFVFLTIVIQSSNGLCKWYGFAPFCFIGNSCPDGCFKTLENNKGDGLRCWFSHKKYCCCPKRALDQVINNLISDDDKK